MIGEGNLAPSMSNELEKEAQLEIGHVLFIDIVGFSKLLVDEQSAATQRLNQIVRDSEQFRADEASDKLIRLPTGDGVVLVFFSSPEAPARCAMQIARALKDVTFAVRMGIHSGPVHKVRDVDGRTNLAGTGVNMAQRVMDCGDAGHILMSRRVAEDLEQHSRWRPRLHHLGQFEVKHGVKIDIVSLQDGEVGNGAIPEKLKDRKAEATSPLAKPLIVAGVLLALAVIGGFLMMNRSGRNVSAVPTKSVAIFPFKPLSSQNRDEVLENGMADTLIAKLSTVSEIVIPSLSSAQKYADREHDLVAAGRLLHVRSILEGTLQRAADRIRVSARLINVADGSSMWSDTFDEKFTDVFAVEDAIAQKVADALRLRLSGEEQKRLTKRYTENTEAYQLYLKGRYEWNRYSEQGYRKSIDFFKQAAEKDPNYALAYSGIADSYSLLGEVSFLTPKEAFENARSYAQKALQLDETLSEAHLSLGIVKLYYDWDVPAAAKELVRAKELDPHNVQVYHFNGHRLEFQERFDEAIAEFKRGLDIEPTNLIVNAELANAYYFMHQSDSAIAQCRKTLDLDPNFELGVLWLAQSYEQKGMYQEALNALNKLTANSEPSPFALAEIGCSEAGLGHRAEAEQIIKKMEDRIAGGEYIDPTLIAYVYIVLGDRDSAFRWLERGFQERSGNMPWMKIEPKFDPLRGDPRLVDLIRRIGI